MSSRWFRFYDDAINDPKILKLSDKLHRVWIGILCVASKNDGKLPPLDDMALMIRINPEKLDEAIKSLMISGLIDEDGPILSPHNWNARQFKSDVSTERVKRFRKQQRNVSVTPPETETETEKKETEANASGAEAPPDPSEPERQFFKRGREILGKSSGGQLAKLLKAAGGNVSLARSKIELAATKNDAHDWIAKVITHAEAGTGPPAKPLTQHQIERQESREILNDLQKFIDDSSGRGSDADLGLLRFDPGDGQKSVHGGPGRDLVDLSARRGREGG